VNLFEIGPNYYNEAAKSTSFVDWRLKH
jgi:hypothetical protein